MANPLKYAPYICYPAAFDRSRSNFTSIITEIRLKIWSLASRLLRSLKVIGTDTDRSATYDFLLINFIHQAVDKYNETNIQENKQ